ncbi:MAG: FliG C-terminal domain-containing protein [Planctomycetota bacterium]|jgi:flagellar motor switch protein FliG
MALDGAKRAAMLLLSLDPNSAAQLLKSAEPDTARRIVAELTTLTQGGQKVHGEAVRDFVKLLRQKPKQQDPVHRLLEMAVGEQGAPKLLKEAQELAATRDPFAQMRSAEINRVVGALEGESSQVVALVAGELPTKKCIQMLSLLDEKVRTEVIHKMTGGQDVSPSVRLKVATALQGKMEEIARRAAAAAAATGGRPVEEEPADSEIKPQQKQHRRVAVVLRGLSTPIREGLLKSLAATDAALVGSIKKMMVMWQDIAAINDRAMQEGLRVVDSRKLALAMVKADPPIMAKVRANISERAGTMLDEESSLMSSPKADDITQSRELILNALRQINERGDMTFEEK